MSRHQVTVGQATRAELEDGESLGKLHVSHGRDAVSLSKISSSDAINIGDFATCPGRLRQNIIAVNRRGHRQEENKVYLVRYLSRWLSSVTFDARLRHKFDKDQSADDESSSRLLVQYVNMRSISERR